MVAVTSRGSRMTPLGEPTPAAGPAIRMTAARPSRKLAARPAQAKRGATNDTMPPPEDERKGQAAASLGRPVVRLIRRRAGGREPTPARLEDVA